VSPLHVAPIADSRLDRKPDGALAAGIVRFAIDGGVGRKLDAMERLPASDRADPSTDWKGQSRRRSPYGTLARLLGATVLSMLAGCASIGPKTVSRDRFDYVCSISDSWKRQMLHNLLKVRYSDAPVFLDVTSVISSYTYSGEVSAFGQVSPTSERGDTFAGVGGNLAYADRPTISYAPLSGEKFTRSMMTPLPISGILYLLQSGYPADMALRICAHSISGLTNIYSGNLNQQEGDPRFAELMAAMRRSQLARGLGIRQKTPVERETAVLYLRDTSEVSRDANRRIRELLELDVSKQDYEVTYGTFRTGPDQIVIQSRSILQMMTELASYISVPESDVAEGRVYRPARSAEEERLFASLIAIHNGEVAPADAYVSARYRGRQYWIDDRDVSSKSALSFLLLIFSLVETGAVPMAAPQLTVPAR